MTWGVHTSLVPIWFDPAETLHGTPFMVLNALHDAVVKPMPGKSMSPSLAESWSMSSDGLVYEFVLRKGARFHTGEPVTAEDVKFSFDRYRGIFAKGIKEKVAAVETPDPGRVRFRLKQPWPDFMTFYGTRTSGAGITHLKAVGIQLKLRPLERAAFFKGVAEKKYKNVIYLFSGASGNAATWLEAYAVAGGLYAYGSYPDLDGLFREQAAELDRTRRESILHRMQQLVYERAQFAPIWDFAFLHGVGPRVEESGLGLLGAHGFSAPYEDVKLKGK